jgi:hypothetical protein
MMDYFFWHKTFGTNFFLNIQGCSQNYIKTSKLRHEGTKNFIFDFHRPKVFKLRMEFSVFHTALTDEPFILI